MCISDMRIYEPIREGFQTQGNCSSLKFLSFFFFFFIVVLEFELRASCLLGKHATTSATPPAIPPVSE
jgi:hypothetical protein